MFISSIKLNLNYHITKASKRFISRRYVQYVQSTRLMGVSQWELEASSSEKMDIMCLLFSKIFQHLSIVCSSSWISHSGSHLLPFHCLDVCGSLVVWQLWNNGRHHKPESDWQPVITFLKKSQRARQMPVKIYAIRTLYIQTLYRSGLTPYLLSGPGFSVSPTRRGLALGSSLCLWCLCGAFASSW